MRLFMLILSFIVCPNIWGQTISLPIVPLNINLKYINQFDSLGKKMGIGMKFLMILFHYASMLVELKTALLKYTES